MVTEVVVKTLLAGEALETAPNFARERGALRLRVVFAAHVVRQPAGTPEDLRTHRAVLLHPVREKGYVIRMSTRQPPSLIEV